MNDTPKALPGAGELISESWKSFINNWNTTVKISIMFLYVGLAYVASALLVNWNPSFSFLDALVGIAGGIVIFWATIRLILALLALDGGSTPKLDEDGKKAWSLFFPLFWVAILTGLVVFGASLLLIIPGIYFGVALKFSNYTLLDQGKRGASALGASRALVRGRWWGTLWRLIAGGIVFGLLVGAAAWALTLVIGFAIPGLDMFKMASRDGGSTYQGSFNPIAYAVIQFIQMVVLAMFMPLLSGFEVKLYSALKKTR